MPMVKSGRHAGLHARLWLRARSRPHRNWPKSWPSACRAGNRGNRTQRRVAVNGEYAELAAGLLAAEKALKPGGFLAVVTFHSIEDRIVKRFFKLSSETGGQANRYAPVTQSQEPTFRLKSKRAIVPDEAELAENPRARSAKLRIGVRTDAPARDISDIDDKALGLPKASDVGGLH